MLTSIPIYEAARSGEFPQQFAHLSAALQYIQGSEVETVRPWLRLANGQASHGNFLIVSGRVIDDSCPFPPPPLPAVDQELFSQWQEVHGARTDGTPSNASDAARTSRHSHRGASA